jgi:hypothetical protein
VTNSEGGLVKIGKEKFPLRESVAPQQELSRCLIEMFLASPISDRLLILLILFG